MEDTTEQHPAGFGSAARSSSKLRYPLRSAGKGKEEKPGLVNGSESSTASTKRGKNDSIVSKSVSFLELSDKDKSGKPPRRLSISTKSLASPLPMTPRSITPMSESRNSKGKIDQTKLLTRSPGTGRSATQLKFSSLNTVSYWLNQIKLSEAAGKHSISLGFFKLASECGSELTHKMQDELKRYIRRHNLMELDEQSKQLLKSYDVAEDFDSLSISDASSQTAPLPNEDAKVKPSAVNVEHKARAGKATRGTPTINKKPLTNQNVQKSTTTGKGNVQNKSMKVKVNVPISSEEKSGAQQGLLPTSKEVPQENKENKDVVHHMIIPMES